MVAFTCQFTKNYLFWFRLSPLSHFVSWAHCINTAPPPTPSSVLGLFQDGCLAAILDFRSCWNSIPKHKANGPTLATSRWPPPQVQSWSMNSSQESWDEEKVYRSVPEWGVNPDRPGHQHQCNNSGMLVSRSSQLYSRCVLFIFTALEVLFLLQ